MSGLNYYDFMMDLASKTHFKNERVLKTIVTKHLKNDCYKVDASLGNRFNIGCVVFVMGHDFYIELKKADNWHTLRCLDYRFLYEDKEPDLFGVPVIFDDNDFFVKKF